MEKSTFVQLAILCAVFFFIGLIVGDNTDTRPSITVTEINTSPENYFEKTRSILKTESVIYQAYQYKDNKKWKASYKYAYAIKEESKFFSRVKYLRFHNGDAVDRKVIFSNNLPDQQLFIILQE